MASVVPEVTRVCRDLTEVRARAGQSQSKGEPAVRWGWKDDPSQTLQLRTAVRIRGFSWR